METKVRLPKNPRITPKEFGLLKGAINRVFSRSELRKQALDKVTINHFDPKRPRVKKWIRCPLCEKPTPKYQAEVDHIEPRVPIGAKFDEMSKDEYIDRTWCTADQLQGICRPCHKSKCAVERKQRRSKRK